MRRAQLAGDKRGNDPEHIAWIQIVCSSSIAMAVPGWPSDRMKINKSLI